MTPPAFPKMHHNKLTMRGLVVALLVTCLGPAAAAASAAKLPPLECGHARTLAGACPRGDLGAIAAGILKTVNETSPHFVHLGLQLLDEALVPLVAACGGHDTAFAECAALATCAARVPPRRRSGVFAAQTFLVAQLQEVTALCGVRTLGDVRCLIRAVARRAGVPF